MPYNHRLIRSPLAWVGGKTRLLNWILPALNTDARVYVEPFGGSASVLVNRDPVAIEVYNDRDGALVTFLLCVKYHPSELANAISNLPYARTFRADEIAWIRQGAPGRITDIQFSARWFWLNMTGFGGQIDAGFGTAKTSNKVKSQRLRLERIFDFSKRLQNVLIENIDYYEIIRRFDTPETLFYCDPPYIGTEKIYQKGEYFNYNQHRLLATTLGSIKGKAAVSYADHPLLHSLYPATRWRKIQKTRTTTLSNSRVSNRSKQLRELLIMNY